MSKLKSKNLLYHRFDHLDDQYARLEAVCAYLNAANEMLNELRLTAQLRHESEINPNRISALMDDLKRSCFEAQGIIGFVNETDACSNVVASSFMNLDEPFQEML